MIIYRLEDANGWGPFSYNTNWPDDYSGDKSIHNVEGCTVPDVREGSRKERGYWRFGCRNKTQLSKYWGGELDKFVRDGWVVAQYRVRKNYVRFGTKDIEVAFLRKKAVRIYE